MPMQFPIKPYDKHFSCLRVRSQEARPRAESWNA